MAIKPIVTILDHEKELRTPSTTVEAKSDATKSLVVDLLDTLQAGDATGRVGVGLAAPQIGVNHRVAVVEYKGDTDENGETRNALPRTVLINPTIKKFSKEKELLDEGCFSVPEYYGPVERPKKIRVECEDQDGKKVVINASGYYARVIQHEIDHLDGVIYTDYVDKKKLFRYVKNDQGETVVEY